MENIKITLARKPAQLKKIIELQRANLLDTVGEETGSDQGFVTAVHDLDTLTRMNAAAASVIALQERELVGYCLAMTRDFKKDVPALTELIERQDDMVYRGETLGTADYLMMGQICVAETARGKKLADRMYKYLRGCYHLRFPYCVTAIDARNTRSQRVHERIGFETIDRFTADDGRDWIIVAWNWREGMENRYS